MKKRFWIGLCTGLAVFVSVFLVKVGINGLMPTSVFLKRIAFELLLGIVSIIVAKAVFRLPAGTFSLGIGKGDPRKVTARYSLLTLALGMFMTACMLFFKIPPIPGLQGLNILQLLSLLLFASVSEELLCRGLVYGIIAADGNAAEKGRVSPAVIASAIVFSLMHFSIYISGGSYITTIIVMLYTFFLGIICGKAREGANVGAAIMVHFAFNMGGIIAAILINIASMVLTGHLVNK